MPVRSESSTNLILVTRQRPYWPVRLAVFGFFLALYLFSVGTPFYSSDAQVMYETARSLAIKGRLEVAQSDLPQVVEGRDGRFYSKYDPGLPLLAAPLVRYADVLGKEQAADRYALGAIFVMVIPAASMALALMALFSLAQHFYSTRWAFVIVFVAGTATIAWPYARLFFAEATIAGLLSLAVMALVQPDYRTPHISHLLFASLVLGLAMLVRAMAIIYLPGLAYLVWQMMPGQHRLRSLLMLIMFPVLAGLILLWHNYFRFGDVLATGYRGERFSHLPTVGAWGMLFSPGKSIFLYAPPLMLSVLLWRRLYYRHPPLAGSLLILTFSVLFFYGAWWSWHGGWVWGPRFLVPLVPLWCLAWGEIPARRWWLGVALVLFISGLAIQIPGAFTSIVPHYAEVFGDAHPDDATRYAMVHYVPALSPIVAAVEQARAGWWEGQAIFRLKDTGAEGEWVGGLPLALGLILGACSIVIWQEFNRQECQDRSDVEEIHS